VSRNLERALEALDVGAQGSDEPSYGYDNPHACARCQEEPPVDGDLCPGCRAFLLGDSDDDPVSGRPAYRPGVTYAPGVEFSGVPIDFDGIDPRIQNRVPSAFQRAVEAEMQRLSTELLNRTLYGNPDGPPAESRLTGLGAIIENEDRSTWLNPPPIPSFLAPIPDPITSELLEPDRMLSQLRCAMFDAAQRRHVEELRAQGWTGAYAHRRERRGRVLGDTVSHWVLTTIAVPLDGR
jgi:hypothetical protein